MWKICERVTPLLMMQHLPQRNLHTRESQVAFLCGVYYMITLKREISLDFGWVIGLMDLWMLILNIFPPEITTCDCLNTLKITVAFCCSYDLHWHGSISLSVSGYKTTVGQGPRPMQLIFSALRASCMVRYLNDFLILGMILEVFL